MDTEDRTRPEMIVRHESAFDFEAISEITRGLYIRNSTIYNAINRVILCTVKNAGKELSCLTYLPMT